MKNIQHRTDCVTIIHSRVTVLFLLLFIFSHGVEVHSQKLGEKDGNESMEHPGRVSKEDIKWWTDAKFGMFIHWGPYAIFEGEWNGRQVPVGENAEWIMQKLEIPAAEYRKVAATFNPIHFDADQWTDLARKAGMKYLVITAKHHDGFAMYDSRISDYNIVDYTPFLRDPMKELSTACKERDIRFCFYYSHREDWDHPYAYGNYWDFETSQQNGYEYEPEKPFSIYLEEKAKPQLKELLTNYGPIGLLWFDRGLYTRKQGYEFIKLIRDLQPDCIINGRVGHYYQDLIGDYQNLSDNGMPATGVEEFWETPQTLNETWGYSRFDTLWKTPTEIIHRLAEIVSKGGNYLLNIGPKSDGTIPQASVDILLEVGNWMKENHKSIYGTTASPLPVQDWGFCTASDSTLFLHVLQWPEDQQLIVRGLKNRIIEAKRLADNAILNVIQSGTTPLISLTNTVPDPYNTVIALRLDSLPEADPPLLAVSAGDTILLNNMTAWTTGKTVKRYNRKGKLFISKWDSPGDQAAWMIDLEQPGVYSVYITYSAPNSGEGSNFIIEAGLNRLNCFVEKTGASFEYQSFDLGRITFEQAGKMQIKIRPAEDLTGDLMYFKSIELRPLDE